MFHFHIASSKLLCSKALHNVLQGTLIRMHLEVYKLFKGNFADALISFQGKTRTPGATLPTCYQKKLCRVFLFAFLCLCFWDIRIHCY